MAESTKKPPRKQSSNYDHHPGISPQDRLRLAERILLSSAILFVLIAAAKIFVPNESVNAVWDFSKYVLLNLVSIITGFLFGSKSAV